jgi:hypothetical protein
MIMANCPFGAGKLHKAGFNFDERSEARQTYGGG